MENLTGTGFDDTLTGSSAANVINAGAGDDIVRGGGGDDTLDGGAGTGDTLDYSDAGSVVIANLEDNTNNQNDTISDFENLIGTSR